jgi:hypothetical protein
MSEILDAWRRAQAAEHEGAHLSAAHHFGWVAASAELRTDGAESEFVWPEELGIFERGRQHCMILLVASEFAGTERRCWRSGEGFRYAMQCSSSAEVREQLLAHLRRQAILLNADEAFRARAYRVAKACSPGAGSERANSPNSLPTIDDSLP